MVLCVRAVSLRCGSHAACYAPAERLRRRTSDGSDNGFGVRQIALVLPVRTTTAYCSRPTPIADTQRSVSRINDSRVHSARRITCLARMLVPGRSRLCDTMIKNAQAVHPAAVVGLSVQPFCVSAAGSPCDGWRIDFTCRITLDWCGIATSQQRSCDGIDGRWRCGQPGASAASGAIRQRSCPGNAGPTCGNGGRWHICSPCSSSRCDCACRGHEPRFFDRACKRSARPGSPHGPDAGRRRGSAKSCDCQSRCIRKRSHAERSDIKSRNTDCCETKCDTTQRSDTNCRSAQRGNTTCSGTERSDGSYCNTTCSDTGGFNRCWNGCDCRECSTAAGICICDRRKRSPDSCCGSGGACVGSTFGARGRDADGRCAPQ